MKCPICREKVTEFRQHALQHVRNDEAYAVEVYSHKKGSSRLTLHAITEPLNRAAVKKFRKRLENSTTSIIDGRKLRMIEARGKMGK